MESRVEATAERLMTLRAAVQKIRALEDHLVPSSIAEAYAVQDEIIGRHTRTIAAWKVGASAEAVQEKLGVKEPFSGAIFEGTVFASPASVLAANFTHTLIESEFAFRVGREIAPRPDQPYTRDELGALFDAVVPAIEIIAPVFEPAIGGEINGRIADLGVSAGLVHGQPTQDWRDRDLARHTVTLRVGDDVVGEGTGALVLGDPVNSLLWAVNHLGNRNRTLMPGQLITTGTTTGVYELGTGRQAVADFGDLGTVSLTFDV
ncbi:MAG: hypothetical protein AAFR23_07590 [Pseudomonadota bacterium]